MSLAEKLQATKPAPTISKAKTAHPTGFEPGFEFDGNKGFVNTGPLEDRPTTWDAQIIDAGMDPAEVEVVEPVQVRGWDGHSSEGIVRMHYYRLTVRRRGKDDSTDFASLMKLARASRRKPKVRPESPESATVIVYADPQTGKVASRGGSADLIERVSRTLVLLDDYMDRVPSDGAYVLDGGDAIEGFENTPQQQFTNDLSLPKQVELASDLLFEFVDLAARKRPAVTVAGVGSNHCRWRKGKDALGLPGDDWGVFMLRQLRKALSLNDAYGHVSVTWPEDHEETLALDVCGTVVGLAHGHQASSPEGLSKWWAGQTHGGQPVGHASILVTGHWHNFRTQPSGRDPWSKREKRIFVAPTLDNGSDWYRLRSGEDSDPGLLVFTVDRNGWRNMEVLRP